MAHTLLLMYATGSVALRPRAPRVQGQVILRQNRPILPPGIGAAYLRRQGDAYINSNVCATPPFFYFSTTRDHLAGRLIVDVGRSGRGTGTLWVFKTDMRRRH